MRSFGKSATPVYWSMFLTTVKTSLINHYVLIALGEDPFSRLWSFLNLAGPLSAIARKVDFSLLNIMIVLQGDERTSLTFPDYGHF